MSRVFKNPKMIDEKEVRLLLKNISTKEIVNSVDLSVKDMFRICRCLDPDNDKKYVTKEGNYPGATCAMTKAFPVVISQMFLNCLWWETFEFDGRTFEGYHERHSETGRRFATIKKQLYRLHDNLDKAEKEKNKVMEEKGLISRHQLEQELADQKTIHNEQMDKKHIEGSKAYKTLQKRLADSISDNKMLQEQLRIKVNDVNNRDSHIKELMAQTSKTPNSLPPPQ